MNFIKELQQQVKELQEERRKALELSSITSREAVVLEIENQDLKDTIEKIEKLNRGYDSDLPIGYKINIKELLSDNLEFDNAEQAEKYLLDKLSDKGEKV